MGEDKALLVVEGAPMALRVAAALRRAGALEVFAVGGDAVALGAHGLPVVPDDRPGEGPFPATLTALRHARHEVVAVLSCDLLRPSAESVSVLCGALHAAGPAVLGAVPLVDGHRQWTHAVWRREALDPLQVAYDRGARSLRRGAGQLPLREVTDIGPGSMADADTRADLPPDSAGAVAGTGSLPPMEIPEIDVAGLAERRAEGVPLIDVREDAEFAVAHVPGAQHIPLGQVADRIGEVPNDQTVYVICARGSRSARAVEHYRAQGIDAVNVAGGMVGWMHAGLPAESPGGGAGGA
jgi:rhodanese-related sulfurtransferase/molybdopterin-guanine dinucleotide biosynthesis protein A